MREIVEKSWDELSPVWHALYDHSATATPFQSYEFLAFTGKGKPYRKDMFRLFGIKEWNLVLYQDGKAVAIAPLLVKKSHQKHMVYLRGQFTTANQLDFIYEDWSYDDFRFLMDYIKEKLANASFSLERISERTVTCRYLKEYFSSGEIVENECFSIPIAASYEAWLKSLSKSARHNLSTHYNRLKRDEKEWFVCFCRGSEVDQCLCKKLMWVYADRFIIKNKFKFGSFTKLVTYVLRRYLMKDQMTRWMNSRAENVHAVLYIGSEVAAFSSGVICRDKRILLSRLAIFTKYGKYSPGGILISSMIKHIIEQNESGAMDIAELDLSQGGGGGMSYKQAYGGKIHYCYEFHA